MAKRRKRNPAKRQRALATVERMERLSHPVRVCGLKLCVAMFTTLRSIAFWPYAVPNPQSITSALYGSPFWAAYLAVATSTQYSHIRSSSHAQH